MCLRMSQKNGVNLLTPKNVQHLISSYNVTPESHSKVTRIKKIISCQRGC